MRFLIQCLITKADYNHGKYATKNSICLSIESMMDELGFILYCIYIMEFPRNCQLN